MSEPADIVLCTRASQMLAEAKTVPDFKKVADMCAAAATWARRHNLGKEAVMHAEEYRLRAERGMGEALKAMPTNKGGQPMQERNSTGNKSVPVEPSLADIGITKRESSDAKTLAAIPRDEFEAEIADAVAKKRPPARTVIVKKQRSKTNKAEHETAVAKAAASLGKNGASELSTVCEIRHCSCAELLAEVKPDAIITDPPYPREFLPVFRELAVAVDVPLVAVMVGQTYLPEVLEILSPLRYRWTLAYMTPGQALRQWERNVDCTWKPVLLFGTSGKYLRDVFTSDASDKRFHEWGQSESGTIDLVERLTEPGQLVCDPFLGGGATAIACLSSARRFIGCDVDAEAVKKSKQRTEAFYARR